MAGGDLAGRWPVLVDGLGSGLGRFMALIDTPQNPGQDSATHRVWELRVRTFRPFRNSVEFRWRSPAVEGLDSDW